MSEINIDAALVREGGAQLSRTEEKVVEMSNGCICCMLREDLLEEVALLADERTITDLLIEQIEFYNVLVLNKVDLITPEEQQSLMAILQALNPRARIEISEFGRVPVNRVLQTGLFDFEEASQAPGWLMEMRGEHIPEITEYGIGSFHFAARRPFHPLDALWND